MVTDLTLLLRTLWTMWRLYSIYVWSIIRWQSDSPHVPSTDQWLESGCLAGVRISQDTLQVVELSVSARVWPYLWALRGGRSLSFTLSLHSYPKWSSLIPLQARLCSSHGFRSSLSQLSLCSSLISGLWSASGVWQSHWSFGKHFLGLKEIQSFRSGLFIWCLGDTVLFICTGNQ